MIRSAVTISSLISSKYDHWYQRSGMKHTDFQFGELEATKIKIRVGTSVIGLNGHIHAGTTSTHEGHPSFSH